MSKSSSEAALFRAFHMMVDKEIREEIFGKILEVQLGGSHDKFEDLAIMVLAYTASGKIPPSVAQVCRDLLAVVLHSISLRTLKEKAASEKNLAGAVAASLESAKRKIKKLDTAVKSEVPQLTLDELEVEVVAVEPQKVRVKK